MRFLEKVAERQPKTPAFRPNAGRLLRRSTATRERRKSRGNRQLRGVATKNLPLDLAWMCLRTWATSGAGPATSAHRPLESRSSTSNANSTNKNGPPAKGGL